VWLIPLRVSECLMEMGSGMCGVKSGTWQLCRETALVLIEWVLDAVSGRSYS